MGVGERFDWSSPESSTSQSFQNSPPWLDYEVVIQLPTLELFLFQWDVARKGVFRLLEGDGEWDGE